MRCMEFHVRREARERYYFDEALFGLRGSVVFANFHAARVFAQRMNETRDLVRFPEKAVRAGEINAMGLIDEIMHHVAGLYRHERNPQVMHQALEWLESRFDADELDRVLRQFIDEFPPLAVYRREASPSEYLDGETDGIPNRRVALEEMLMLWLTNRNPGTAPYRELFDEITLDRQTQYRQVMSSLYAFFQTQPTYGPDDANLVDMLHSPAVAEPHSLSGQLEYIRRRWGYLLGDHLYRLLSGLDLIKEEEKVTFTGPGPSSVPEFGAIELSAERFSPDMDWMPSLVLLAKNVYVWLDQLSKQYGRAMTRLDDVSDGVLDTLARRGFSGLWLIGLWERSPASKRIKQISGNPEAVASAYALFDYQIAADLGGAEAYQDLRDRAWQRGIRLASDMVPNHVGIDGKWVIEHPDWFIGLDECPFPSYSFSGPNLSWDARVGLYLEDHYYDRTDAAVVFKRVDTWTGDERYIYHGNDGTSMPWNDTAQLNYLNPEVREAVIQTILHVARQFPVIRFDAAMTLAKKHYQRLWFPEPGSGGAIPSRAEHGMSKAEFDAHMPAEFWREVVDRVAEEAPDTLLLAEAFWLMEGYFVRTLGMHRVYNSAFMNMLRDEENAKYRLVVKNTLEFDPRILKRYVNFMNNPDERTAVDQFGKGDKYFGIATMMVTMPGLPMFGHGQLEGYAEKYGMEYRRAYWDEQPDPALVERHEREICPLLHRRYLFAEVDAFRLYDFYTASGQVTEDVFAYSNRRGYERALVVYHNKYAEVRGWIRTSVHYAVQTSGDGSSQLAQSSLAEGLGLSDDEGMYTIFRDHVTGLEYIRGNRGLAEGGLYVELAAYQYHVFLDFREVHDDDQHPYTELAAHLGGRGVPSVEEALKWVLLEPIHRPFRELVHPGHLRHLVETYAEPSQPAPLRQQQALDEAERRVALLLDAIVQHEQSSDKGNTIAAVAAEVRQKLQAALRLPTLMEQFPELRSLDCDWVGDYLEAGLRQEGPAWSALLGWTFTHLLGKVLDPDDDVGLSRSWMDEWLLGQVLEDTLNELTADERAARQALATIKVLISHQRWFEVGAGSPEPTFHVLEHLLRDAEVQRLLGVNRHQGILWFRQESFDQLLWWLWVTAVVTLTAEASRSQGGTRDDLVRVCRVIRQLQAAEAASGYQVEQLLEAARYRP
ncbi:MAG: alpha-amylase [Anaerolineales bacterium]|nr:alpha-amylase [Anaerolineales bacterium]